MPARADVPAALTAYVKARAADADGRVETAAAGYAAALAASPGNAVIATRAYREALAAGDLVLARSAAATLAGAGVAPADTAVLSVSRAIATRDWAGANAAADRMAGDALGFLVPPIRAWIAFDRGDPLASAPLTIDASNALARRVNAENRALLLIAAGDADAGMEALRPLLGTGANPELRIDAATLVAARGRRDAARALLTGDDPLLAAVRDTLSGNRKIGAAFGVARLFTRLAGEVAVGEARTLAVVLGRAALELDPTDDRARMVLAEALSNDGAQGRALAVLDAVHEAGPYAPAARATRLTLLIRAGRASDALAAAERLAAAPGAGAGDAQRYGDLLVAAGRFDTAAAAYDTAIRRAGPAPGWILYLQRGGALEQAGRWDQAEPMLARAVALAPDEAVALNYLGYARIERGEDLAGARALLERAVALQPDNGAFTDSLGWAYVRSGDIARAVPLLERAARAEPADVTIQEHLGDAYWRSGRRYEARYAWRAAAVNAVDSDAARLSGKLAAGLPR